MLLEKYTDDDEIEWIPEEKKSKRVLEEKRSFKYDIVKVDKEKNKVYYKEYVEFASLNRGEFFGGRALLGEEVAMDGFEYDEYLKKIPKAKLTVVSRNLLKLVITLIYRSRIRLPSSSM